MCASLRFSGLDVALTPLRFLGRAAEVHPDRAAVIDGPRRLDYRDFAELTTRAAHALRHTLGATPLGPARRVDSTTGTSAGTPGFSSTPATDEDSQPLGRLGVLNPNSVETLLAHYAAPLAGSSVVALNTRLAPPEITYILDHADVAVLWADAELFASLLKGLTAPLAESVSSLLQVVLTPGLDGTVPDLPEVDTAGVSVVSFPDFLSNGATQPLPWAVVDDTTPIAINYTSGTTGRPKGVVYTHRGAYLSSLGQVITQRFDQHSRYLWTLPMFHCNGWVTTWALTAVAGTHVCLRAVRGEDMWHLIDTEGINRLAGTPAVYTALTSDPAAHPVTDLAGVCAGAPPAPALLRRCEELGLDIVQVYGLTETYGPISLCEPQAEWESLSAADRAALKTRQGVSVVTSEEIRVVIHRDTAPDPVPGGDAAPAPAPQGVGDSHDLFIDVPADGLTLGEIVVRGNNVMAGYLKDEAATARAFDGGWFHTGDLGVKHPSGYVQLLDRAKDIIISGGENISTIEVEAAMYEHPEVVDCAVIGVPDDTWGERPKAFVVLSSTATVDTEGLIAHCRALIAGYKVPREIEIIRALPRTSTGKVRKNALRDAASG